MKQFISRALNLPKSFIKRNPKVRSLKQAISDYSILLFGLAAISIGAFTANQTAGWIVMGTLAVVFNERVSTNA